MQNAWRFQWCENGKKHTRNFPVQKYGANGARGLVRFHQEEMYPVEPEDDLEFIQEIKDRMNK